MVQGDSRGVNEAAPVHQGVFDKPLLNVRACACAAGLGSLLSNLPTAHLISHQYNAYKRLPPLHEQRNAHRCVHR